MKPKTKRYILSGLIVLIIIGAAIGFLNYRDYMNEPQWYYKVGQEYYSKKDYNIAFSYFNSAAARGYSDAQYAVGYMCGSGQGTKQDIAEQIEWYIKAANNGHINSQVALGFICLDGVNKDYKKAFEWFNKAAAQGNIIAQNIVAGMHYWGEGTTRDYTRALQWYNKVVEHKDNETDSDERRIAYFQIGLIHYLGNGVEKKIPLAEKFWQEGLKNLNNDYARSAYEKVINLAPQAIGDNDPAALFELGDFYTYFSELPRPSSTRQPSWVREENNEIYRMHAYEYIIKAAELGYAPAQIKVAVYYMDKKNYKDAFLWLEKAAQNGNSDAYKILGDMYYEGISIPKNYRDALDWYLKAAMKDNLFAQERLAIIYFNGQGTEKDVVRAYTWLNIVLSKHNNQTIKWDDQQTNYDMFERLTREMSVNQVVTAQEYSKQLVKEIESRKQELFETPQKQDRTADKTSPETIKRIGSGFIITSDGYIVTNNHVIKNATSIKVVSEKETYKAELVKEELKNDLAILKTKGSFTAAPLAREKSAKLGEKVFTIGFPNPTLQGFSPKITDGLISSIYGIQDDPRLYQISVAIQPGNSGGPLVDKYGNVVGVVTLTLNAKETFKITGSIPQNVNYAIKSSYVRDLIQSQQNLMAKILEPNNKEVPFEDIVQHMQKSVVLILVY